MAARAYGSNLPKEKLRALLDASDEDAEVKEVIQVVHDIEEVPINKLKVFPNHPFTVDTTAADFDELVESIRDNGIISEILVRPSGEEYEIISGHRRVAAAKKLHMNTIPARIKALSDYEATVAMVHSNMYRDKILYSEKAKAYRMIRDAESHQGVPGVDTAALIGENGNDSKRQVYRYIKLSYLNDELLNKVDNEEIAFQTGVELGFLDAESQKKVSSFIDTANYKLSLEDAIKLKEKYQLTKETLEVPDIITTLSIKKDEKPISKEKKSISFKVATLREFFGDVVDTFYMESIMLKLLEMYSAGDINIDKE